MPLLLREADVAALADMPSIVEWVEASFRELGDGDARNLPRERVRLPSGTLHVLAAGSPTSGYLGLKAYTSFREGTRFLVLLYGAEDGRLLALVEADRLGQARTGAASAVATRHLARRDTRAMALFGTGWQARGQLDAIRHVHELDEVRVFGRDPDRRRRFVEEMAPQTGLRLVACESAQEALEGAGVVTTITTAADPLFPADQVQAGAHVNAAGSNSLVRRELDPRLPRQARVVVDSRAQARQEAGDLLVAVERGWLDWDRLPELGEVVAGQAAGRRNDDEITIFESQGLGVQDVVVAGHLYERACERGLGEDVGLFAQAP
jgi:ornithine cyclodeaminase/alanine dehydrogenase-like protein (mu-crystallin family)